MSWHHTLFLIVVVSLGIVIGATPFPSEKRKKAEQAAEETICRELAAEVQAENASRFDYMATRCSARLLTEPQGE